MLVNINKMILLVMIFFLFYHTNSNPNSNRSAVSYSSTHIAKHRRSETFGNHSLHGVPRHDSLETYELDTVKLPSERAEENVLEITSETKSFHEGLSLLAESPHLRLSHSSKPLQRRQLAPFLWNKQKSHSTNGIQTTRHHQSRQKRFAPPCLPPSELSLHSSGGTATVTKWDMTVHVFPPSLPVTVKAVAVFCCYFRETHNLENSVSSSDIGITSNNWHDLDVRMLHSNSTLQQTYELQITSLINSWKKVEKVRWHFPYNLVRLNVSITGDGVRWYEGPKRHECSRYPTTTRPAPATTTKSTTPVAKENTTTVAPGHMSTLAGPDGMSQQQSAQTMIIIFSSVLGLLVIVVVILGVVIMRMRKKGRVTRDVHAQTPGDASRPPQNWPTPRQVDQTTFSAAPTATISPLTVTRAGGDAEVEYYEPPECFPIDSTSAAYVIFDDDGNPIN